MRAPAPLPVMPFSGHRWIGPPSCAWEDKHGHAATYSSAVDASRIRRSDATGLRRRHGSGHCVWRQKLRCAAQQPRRLPGWDGFCWRRAGPRDPVFDPRHNYSIYGCGRPALYAARLALAKLDGGVQCAFCLVHQLQRCCSARLWRRRRSPLHHTPAVRLVIIVPSQRAVASDQ